MLSLSEDLLFAWEPADLGTSWQEKNFSKTFVVVGQKILVSKSGCCIRGGLTF